MVVEAGVHEIHHVQRPGRRPARYEAPSSLKAALAMLEEHGERARPVAGGTDLLVELDRGARPDLDILVDLGRIPGLDEITADEDTIPLGALVTHNQVVASDLCRDCATPLAQACWEVGSPQLRNRATVAGNLVTASPANDTISALIALDATVEMTSAAGTRFEPVGVFVTGFRQTVLAPGELVTAILVPRLISDQRGVFVKLGLRRAQAISVVHLAAVVTVSDGIATAATLAIGSVAPTVVTVAGVADALVGRPFDSAERAAAAIEVAASTVAEAIAPIDDVRAPADYRTDLAVTMTRRALTYLADRRQSAPPIGDAPRLWGEGFEGRYPTVASPALAIGRHDPITASVNGRPLTATGASSSVLLDWLRDHAGTTGVKEGCAEGECGACTVFLDGAAVMACLVPAGRAAGAEITTIEGLGDSSALHLVQEAFIQTGAVQCGFCTPGLVMASAKLLEEHPDPTADQVRAGLAGNLCRCTGYAAIHQAVHLAANNNPANNTADGTANNTAADDTADGTANNTAADDTADGTAADNTDENTAGEGERA